MKYKLTEDGTLHIALSLEVEKVRRVIIQKTGTCFASITYADGICLAEWRKMAEMIQNPHRWLECSRCEAVMKNADDLSVKAWIIGGKV